MRKFVVYAVAILGNVLLINWSELWYGAEWFTEWLFGFLTIGLFALFLQGWKRYSPNGVGLILITAFGLLTINSIFFVQNFPASICSLLLGLLLMPLYKNHQDAVLTAWGFVLINILISIEVQSDITMSLLFLTTGIGALVGFRLQFLLLKRCFTVFFSLTALVLLFDFLLSF
ncbi:hypothetical protein [Bacillus sp. FSL K6-3431]|uniref:hypothetical protein n=1 Tax=Bacillus sp. FSL K6-3431 TaxID=2921500 RepID=UPI0030F5E6DA